MPEIKFSHSIAEYDTPSENITVRNVTCHGPFAGIAIGSEMSGGVRNVTVEHVTYTRANSAVNIKTGNTRGGFIQDISYNNILVNGSLNQAIHLDMYHYYNNPNPSCGSGFRPVHQVRVQDIYVTNINGVKARIMGSEYYHLFGMKDNPIQYLFLENVTFPPARREQTVWNCSEVQGSVLRDSVLPWPPCPQLPPVEIGGSFSVENKARCVIAIILFVLFGVD